MEPKDRMEALAAQIRYHSHRYHVLDDPVISDDAYDALFRELQALEADHPELVSSDSPTRRIGGEVRDEFRAVEHPRPMLSLSNAFSPDELRAWRDRFLRLLPEGTPEPTYVAEPKVDGLTVVLHYLEGSFALGATRGDGHRGEDITPNLRTVRSLPMRIPVSGAIRPPSRLVVRGEAYMGIQAFGAFNAQQEAAGKRTYANPRNTAAGSLRVLDSSITASRPLSLVCYQVVEKEGGPHLASQWQALCYLEELGFPVGSQNCRITEFERLVEHCVGWREARHALDFEADGLVIKIDDVATQERLGAVGNAPRWALAYKYPTPEAVTRLNRIVVNVGRTGTLTPAADLDPVRIGGVTVTSATLHNADYVAENDIREGDMVTVKRAGEVIPQVVGPVLALRPVGSQPWCMPTFCPACGEPVVHPEGEVAFYCANASCPAQLVRAVEHFASRGAMDIEGFGTRQAELLVELRLLRDVADIYRLEAPALLRLEGYADKRVTNLLAAIEASKQQSPARLLTALGIRGIGGTVAQALLERLGSLEALAAASPDALQHIPGIGPKLAGSVSDWFARPSNRRVLDKLVESGVRTHQRAAEPAGPQPFSGLTFVITGTLPTMSREQATAFIEARGGRVTGAVTAGTNYLVVGDKAGSKLAKAQKLGIAMVEESGLRRMAGAQ